MKLFYWDKPSVRNFGDELNPWLWEKLLPGAFDGNPDVLFVGIGTLINTSVPPARRVLVFGSGVGYNAPAKPDQSWKFYCVRGPKSAASLGLPPETGIVDPAVYIQRFVKPATTKTSRCAFIPHWRTTHFAWEPLCAELGITYIDPCGSIDQVMKAIGETELLLAEAMHGAIVADALRVPWVGVRSGSQVLPFKWEDWCQSIGVSYNPQQLPSLDPPAEGANLNLRTQQWWHRSRAAGAFRKLVRNPPAPTLSSDATLPALLARLDDKLDEFKRDVANNCFASDA